MRRLWKQIWRAQGKKCAKCDKPVALKDTAKSSYSLELVCWHCYNEPHVKVILDEFGEWAS